MACTLVFCNRVTDPRELHSCLSHRAGIQLTYGFTESHPTMPLLVALNDASSSTIAIRHEQKQLSANVALNFWESSEVKSDMSI